MSSEHMKPKKGFTLVELLVVIAIIAILAAILFPVFSKAREKASQATCMSNQRQLAIGVMAFVQDHDELLPTPAEWIPATGLSSDPKIFSCPSSNRKRGLRATASNPDYGYNAKLVDPTTDDGRLAIGEVESPEQVATTCDLVGPAGDGTFSLSQYANSAALRHLGGFVVSYLDGHVSYFPSLDAAVGTSFDLYAIAGNSCGVIDFSDFGTFAEASAALVAAGFNTVAGTLSGGVLMATGPIWTRSVNIDKGLALLIEGTTAVQVLHPLWVSNTAHYVESTDDYAVHQNWVKVLPNDNKVAFGFHRTDLFTPGKINTNINPQYLGREVDFPAAGKYRLTLKLSAIRNDGDTRVNSNTGGVYYVQTIGATDRTVYRRDFRCTVTNLANYATVNYSRALALGSDKCAEGFGLRDPRVIHPVSSGIAGGAGTQMGITRIMWSN